MVGGGGSLYVFLIADPEVLSYALPGTFHIESKVQELCEREKASEDTRQFPDPPSDTLAKSATLSLLKAISVFRVTGPGPCSYACRWGGSV